jgi:type I restriction enzyme, S subunit
MEVKPGYKQTEVGVIPEEWDVRTLAESCAKITDGTHDTPTPVRSGVPFLTAIHIKENTIDYDGCLYLAKADHQVIYSRCNPERGDVLMVNIGAGVATTALVNVNFEFSLKNVALLKPATSRTSGSYLNHCLSRCKPEIIQALSSGGAQPFLSLTQIGQIRIPFPLKAEQEAIAGALNDVDALLAGLDRLIAKKRDIKQAAMQQLLTGQTRLPGFHGEWEVKRLGEVAKIVMGQSPSSSNYNSRGNGLPLIQGNADIMNRRTIKRIFTTQITKRGRSGDILMSVRAPVGEVSRATFDVCLGRGVCAIRFPNDYLYHLLILLESSWSKHSKGSTFDSVSSADVQTVEMNLPPDPVEQVAIAAVLSDMDTELSALEARRDKTRDLKQAMMQELLTGKTRLVTQDNNAGKP